MMLAFLISPIGRWVAGALIIAALLGGVYLKIRNDAQAEVIVRIEKEKTDAINTANAARDRLRTVCNSAPDKCLPDDWFRD